MLQRAVRVFTRRVGDLAAASVWVQRMGTVGHWAIFHVFTSYDGRSLGHMREGLV